MASVRAIKRARSISKSGINCTSANRFNSASIFQPCDFAFSLIVCSLLRDAGSATSLSSDLTVSPSSFCILDESPTWCKLVRKSKKLDFFSCK